MSTVYLTLGALNLASAGEDFNLTATISLTFLCADAVIQPPTERQLLKDLRSAESVAKRGPGCRIDVDVEFDGFRAENGSLEGLKQNLGLAICEAPWWSQLPICPVMQQSPDCCLDANCPFSIALTDALPDFLSEDDHNNTRSNQDVKIPCGVSVLQVQRIAVTLQFRHLVEKTNPGLLDVPTDNMDMSFEVILDDHHNLHDDSLLLNDQVYAELEENVGEGKHILTGEPQLSPSFGDEDALLIGEDEYIITPFHTPDMSPFNSQESVLPHLTYPDDAPEYDFAPKVAIPAGTARLLTDVAMRTLIGGGQAIPTDGIQLLRPLPRHTVAALMPLLFSPNFSSTMFQRSRFLPTITSTITSLRTTAQSPGLRSKLAKLISRGHPLGRPSPPGAVQAQAYRIMHTSLFSAKSARNLRVKRNEESKEDDMDEESMIIDRSTFSLQGRGVPEKAPWEDISEMEFEDMLEDEPLSEDEIDMLLDVEIMRQSFVPNGSILFSSIENEEHSQDVESMIDIDMRDVEEDIMETRDGSMIEILEESYVAKDKEMALPKGHLDMLF